MRKLLTIAIPTYNRARYLESNLKQLLPQVIKNIDDVDLVLSDNCSPDNTSEIVENLNAKYNRIIKYFHQEKNIGPINNFSFCVNSSDSEYILLLGDDDIVAFGFIDTILDLIKTFKVDILHYNSLSNKPEYGVIVPFYKVWKSNEIIQIYDNPFEFMKDTLDGPSFMSSLVFKRTLWVNGENLFPHNCYGYDWFMNIYAGVEADTRCAFYSMPIVTRFVADGYDDKAAKYYIVGLSRVFENLKCKDQTVYQKWVDYRNNTFRTHSTLLDTYKYRNNYIDIQSEIIHYLSKKSQRLTFWIAMHFPKGLIKIIMKPLYKLFAYLSVLKAKLSNK